MIALTSQKDIKTKTKSKDSKEKLARNRSSVFWLAEVLSNAFEAFRNTIHNCIKQLQEYFYKWLKTYNYERPYGGYGNRGKRPFNTIKSP
ncbi:hypothetical protein FGF1_26780 [Flavobacteriaceae bacterium GF1]